MRKQPRTEAQRTASRANGTKSHGAITPRGKARSSRNNIKHGLLATMILLPGESRDRFLEISHDYADEYGPASPTERDLVQRIIIAQWRLIRVLNYERVTMRQESTALEQVPPIIDDVGVWHEPCSRDSVAYLNVQSRNRHGSVIQLSEMRYQRQYAQAVAQFQQHRLLHGTEYQENDC